MPQSEETPTPNESGPAAKKPRLKREKSPRPDSGATCGQCKYWARDPEGPDGECYWLPPVVHFDADGCYFLSRPPLASSERACGQFRGAN